MPPRFDMAALENHTSSYRHELWAHTWALYEPDFYHALAEGNIDDADNIWCKVAGTFLAAAAHRLGVDRPIPQAPGAAASSPVAAGAAVAPSPANGLARQGLLRVLPGPARA